VNFIDVAAIALVASIPLLVIYSVGVSLQSRCSRQDATVNESLSSHWKAAVFLAFSSIFLWLNIHFELDLDNIYILFIALSLVSLSYFFWLQRRGIRWLIVSLLKIYAFIFVFCLLGASIYLIAPMPLESHFMPAMGNNDIFAYLFRASALFDGLRQDVAFFVSGSSPIDKIHQTSKFSSAYFLSLFLFLTNSPGIAAAAALVAVRTALLHLLWVGFQDSGKTLISSVPLLLFIASSPIIILLSLLFHLSQLMFIYFSLLIFFNARHLLKDTWLSMLLSVLVLCIYVAILYPAAFPVYIATLFIGAAFTYYVYGYKAPWRRIAAITVVAIGCALAFIAFDLHKTDFMHHIGGEYYPLGYLPLLSHWLAPFSQAVFLLRPFDALIQQAIGLVIDLVCLFALWHVVCKKHRYLMGKKLRFLLLFIAAAFLFYQLLFAVTDGNYKAFKVNTIIMTLLSLTITVLIYKRLYSRSSRHAVFLFSSIAVINYAYFFMIPLDRSIPQSYDSWIENMLRSKETAIFYKFEGYRINMYLPLALKDKQLYPLTKSYYSAVEAQQVCRYFGDREARVYVHRDLAQEMPGRVLAEYPGDILAISPDICSQQKR
jgi:hypothetical protein